MLASGSLFAQDDDFLLSFRHPAVGGYYVNALYNDHGVYLPVGELFGLLYIPLEKGETGFSLQGEFPNSQKFYIDPVEFTVKIGKEVITLSSEDVRVGEMDLFLSVPLYEELFGLIFQVDMGALSLSLTSIHTLPVEERKQRDKLRKDLERKTGEKKDSPLLFPRKHQRLTGGMVDYSLGYSHSDGSNLLNYTFLGGIELLGGDIQGSAFGAASEKMASMSFNNSNWRFVPKDNKFLTAIRIGQVNSTSIVGNNILGVSLTNDPVMPRRVYDTYVVEGTTFPDSDVELLVNNQLVDYTRTDEMGYYRFNYPLNYGTARISTRIYTPSGEIIVEEKQIQVPFTFLPKGVMAYNAQAGYQILDTDSMNISFDSPWQMHGDVAYGITKALTAKIGADMGMNDTLPLYYGSLSTRLFKQYLFNLDFAPGHFSRASGSVTYANNTSLQFIASDYYDIGQFNSSLLNKDIQANVFVPFNVFGMFSGIRIGADQQYFLDGALGTQYRFDFNTRIGRTIFRLNFRERVRQSSEFPTNYEQSLASAVVNYNVGRAKSLPPFLRGMFLRLQADYAVRENLINSVAFQINKPISSRGRLQVRAGYDFRTNGFNAQVLLTIDLSTIRSNSQYNYQPENSTFLQNFTGSIGFDNAHQKIIPTNRNQVGQSAVSVRAFIDVNENYLYDEGEEIVPIRGLTLDQGALQMLGRDSILRITQLQPYWKYNVEISPNSIPNPMLAPIVSEFSFEADPNQYKPIDIPLYRTAVIDGTVVYDDGGGNAEPLGGLRLLLQSNFTSFSESMRTFSTGEFYAMNIMPGTYTLRVDPIQLDFLEAKAEPASYTIHVSAKAEGDFIENLNFYLSPKTDALPEEPVLEPELHQFDQVYSLKIQQHIHHYVKAQKFFYERDYQKAREEIETALDFYATSVALALKGTIMYAIGDESEAMLYWQNAKSGDSDIIIPNTQELRKIILN